MDSQERDDRSKKHKGERGDNYNKKPEKDRTPNQVHPNKGDRSIEDGTEDDV